MFLNQFHAMKMKNEVIESVVNSKPSTWWPESWSWHTFDEDERGDEGYGSLFLSISLKVEDDSIEKVMEILTLMGVFIGFLVGLSDLSPPRAWIF